MSRTYRKVPPYPFDEEFKERLKHGLEPSPIGIPGTIDEVWGAKAKKLAKKVANRRRRHEKEL